MSSIGQSGVFLRSTLTFFEIEIAPPRRCRRGCPSNQAVDDAEEQVHGLELLLRELVGLTEPTTEASFSSAPVVLPATAIPVTATEVASPSATTVRDFLNNFSSSGKRATCA